tara:strand:- start:921 stop:2147 length:1227 start_codon:yes stop_codon:yes gene_type:complete
MERIAIETEEDYQKIISKLKEFDVEVIRTDISDIEDYTNGDGVVVQPPPMCPRDFTAMMGDKFYMPGKGYAENFDVDTIFDHLLWNLSQKKISNINDPLACKLAQKIEDILNPNHGSSPKTCLLKFQSRVTKYKTFKYNGKEHHFYKLKSIVDLSEIKELIIQAQCQTIGSNIKFPNNKKVYAFDTIQKWLTKNNVPIVYDEYVNSATTSRVGKDLYFGNVNLIDGLAQESLKNKWQKLFPDYRIHPMKVGGHSDGQFCPVVPGLIISLKKPETYKDSFPDWEVVSLKDESWKKVDGFLKMKEKCQGKWWIQGEEDNDDLIDYIETWLGDWVTYVEESVFDVNMLVIDEKNVMCNGYNKKVYDAFERYGITPHVVNFRHRYFWDGGLHCNTSDISRVGERKDYFPERD